MRVAAGTARGALRACEKRAGSAFAIAAADVMQRIWRYDQPRYSRADATLLPTRHCRHFIFAISPCRRRPARRYFRRRQIRHFRRRRRRLRLAFSELAAFTSCPPAADALFSPVRHTLMIIYRPGAVCHAFILPAPPARPPLRRRYFAVPMFRHTPAAPRCYGSRSPCQRSPPIANAP